MTEADEATLQVYLLVAGCAMVAVSLALATNFRGFGTLWRSWRAVVTTFAILIATFLILAGVTAGQR